jgi:hypothetical protein
VRLSRAPALSAGRLSTAAASDLLAARCAALVVWGEMLVADGRQVSLAVSVAAPASPGGRHLTGGGVSVLNSLAGADSQA